MGLIKIKNLTIRYPEKIICENFSLNIIAGELTGIFGANGTGKTSFLKALMRLAPIEGAIIYEHDLTKKQMGYLPQERYDHIVESYSVEGFLTAVAGNMKGFLPAFVRWERANINGVLACVQMSRFNKVRLRNLSGGERKRVMLAALLLEKPRVLLLDEPLANLDLPSQINLLTTLRNLCNEQNLAVVITGHETNQLAAYLDKTILFGRRVPLVGKFSEVMTEESVFN